MPWYTFIAIDRTNGGLMTIKTGRNDSPRWAKWTVGSIGLLVISAALKMFVSSPPADTGAGSHDFGCLAGFLVLRSRCRRRICLHTVVACRTVGRAGQRRGLCPKWIAQEGR